MKITSLEIRDFPPLKHLKLDGLGSTVIIAGANGSGKTRLKQAIVETMRGNPLMNLTIEATRKEEEEPNNFGGKFISVEMGTLNNVFFNYINSRSYASGGFVGSLVQIDSNRNVAALNISRADWLGGDPDDKETSTDFYFNSFSERWRNFMNYIHQKSAARDKKLADELKKNPRNGEKILTDYPDPLDKYREAFSLLLPGKTLMEINPAQPQEFRYAENGVNHLPFQSLSSGEQEVVKVVFDVLRKEIEHSVILVDEPELHLHPSLAFKLIETLKMVGGHTNQFIFLTHSADLISTYYSTGNVYFIDGIQTGENQAHKLSDLSHSHSQVAQLIGQNLGLFAVGKKLVFIEGKGSSADRLTYHRIAQDVAPDVRFIPAGSVKNIRSLIVLEQQIRTSIFGVDIFMIRDRDGLTDDQIQNLEGGGRIRCLRKRHIENYFLDAEMVFKVAEKLYLLSSNPELSVHSIEAALRRIAEETLNFNLVKNTKEYLEFNNFFSIPTVKEAENKTTAEVKTELVMQVQNSLNQVCLELEATKLKNWIDLEEMRLRTMLATNEWKNNFQGKVIFSRLCAEFLKCEANRIREAYVDTALVHKPDIFADIIAILRDI